MPEVEDETMIFDRFKTMITSPAKTRRAALVLSAAPSKPTTKTTTG